MPKYRVTRPGALADGTYRKAGAVVTLTEAQAKYYLPPHDDRLEEVKTPPAKPPAAQSARPAAKPVPSKG